MECCRSLRDHTGPWLYSGLTGHDRGPSPSHAVLSRSAPGEEKNIISAGSPEAPWRPRVGPARPCGVRGAFHAGSVRSSFSSSPVSSS